MEKNEEEEEEERATKGKKLKLKNLGGSTGGENMRRGGAAGDKVIL